jgi:hypothetical protein
LAIFFFLKKLVRYKAIVKDTCRTGVWLGRHICYNETQVSQGQLRENRNLSLSIRAKAVLIYVLSVPVHNVIKYLYFAFSKALYLLCVRQQPGRCGDGTLPRFRPNGGRSGNRSQLWGRLTEESSLRSAHGGIGVRDPERFWSYGFGWLQPASGPVPPKDPISIRPIPRARGLLGPLNRR